MVDGEEYVFGTPSRWLALVFSARDLSDNLDFGFAGDVPYIAEKCTGAFDALKRPGYIHVVSAEGFRSDTRLGMARHEFVNPLATAVTECERVDNVLDDLRRFPGLRLVAAEERARFNEEMDVPP